MENFTIVIVAPPDTSDPKLTKLFETLSAEREKLATKRRSAEGKWHDSNDVLQQMRNQGATPPDLAPVQAKMRELEIDIFQQEESLLTRVVDEYIPAVVKLRQHLQNVHLEIVSLAQKEVIAHFNRQFDPARWRISEQALWFYVNNHPIVRGASEAAEEVKGNSEQDYARHNRDSLNSIKDRLQHARQKLPALKELAKRAGEAAKLKADEAAASIAQQRAVAEAEMQRQQRVEAEARQRLGIRG